MGYSTFPDNEYRTGGQATDMYFTTKNAKEKTNLCNSLYDFRGELILNLCGAMDLWSQKPGVLNM
jgi:hypothetical protein